MSQTRSGKTFRSQTYGVAAAKRKWRKDSFEIKVRLEKNLNDFNLLFKRHILISPAAKETNYWYLK